MVTRQDGESVVTQHRAQLEGDDWDLMLERKRSALCEAFDADVCEALSVPRGSVVDVDLSLKPEGLAALFGLRHRPSLRKGDVNKRLAQCGFFRTWNLYEPRTQPPAGSAAAPLTAKEGMLPVLRASEECDVTPGKPQSCDVVPSCGVAEECSLVREVPGLPGTSAFPLKLVVDAEAQGLKKGAATPIPSTGGEVVDKGESCSHSLRLGDSLRFLATYRVGFVGCDWKIVVEKDLVRLKNCFVRDVLDIGGVFPKSVENVSYALSGDAVVTVLLEHAASLSQADVLHLLDEAPFSAMWHLHDECVALKSVARTTTFHRVGFVGSDWASGVQPEIVASAFLRDVVDVLDVMPEDVRIAAYRICENLVVDFYVEHSSSMSEARIDELLNGAPFDRVWESYKSGQTPVMRELEPVRVPVRPAVPRRSLNARRISVGKPYYPAHFNKMTKYPRPGLRYRKSTSDKDGDARGCGELLYMPLERPVPSWDYGIELPRVVAKDRSMRWPLRTDFSTARQERRVNLRELNEVLGMQRQQLARNQTRSGNTPDVGLMPLYHNLEAMRWEETKDPLCPYRTQFRYPPFN
ncbi:hypothetical protein TraAM80_08258 [Trypanosoma rangeli]|uniref:Flagellar attachment zone protein 1 conserved domain-containing protein n=1 Tax=Trypanosoma rangeli TaxID=5698 RepID=A0A422N1I9_TRYRA|nr:uncharacterized protein TraAM80_08258 [Trypanosoma rangeli]RNE99320.1 hypothetical protein TraAM80_08258 [Trypanosoma rangeli]|eukprot:RNE99320.1 hypothetical protein TraAM80_08258 [Trypanosoma rangeli]